MATLDGGNSGGDRRALGPQHLHLVLGLRGHELGHAPPVHPARIQPQRHLPRRRRSRSTRTDRPPGLKFINLVIHDARQGFSFWKEAADAEVNGCLIYYNGWNGTDRGHGHGIYTQNQTGTKHIVDNIIFQNFDHGIQAYGSASAYLNNYDIEGNTFSSDGILATPDGGGNLLIGGDRTAQNLTIANNSSTTRASTARTPPSSWATAPAAPTPPSPTTTSPTTRSSTGGVPPHER